MQQSELEDYQYNRIVIIGNGFDLAWGLPTSYSDFILDFFKEKLKESIKSEKSKDSFLIKIIANQVYISQIDDFLNRFKSTSELIENCKHRFTFNIKSELLKLILEKQNSLNWVDIESLYFNLLLSKIEEVKKLPLINRNYSKIELLNNEFEELSTELESYISKVNSKFNPFFNVNSNMSLLNDKMIEKDDSRNNLIIHKKNQIPNPSKIRFLNFNYTNSLEKVLMNLRANFDILNIHGKVGSPNNPIIFGYGDDSHPKYQEIEDEDHNQSLKHIKSFYYFKSNNYLELDKFMADNKYEVAIVGHSCGLSDRTLLKTVFENENCISIKIFYFKDPEDYFQKSIAVSRHFSNKPLLRQKMIPFDSRYNIPQFNSI
ncbi:hypothetical protein EWU23_11855 [Cytophagaceae bacterium 50C-KIRBA]|uniref:Bacteriophage abortive infection AbiH n=1 Tax=Aquirufa beregesia TaxID=2516556 RepID=A0ABX0EYT4_9BACT|nr:AbiH family protein [Aquirufa beregesia]NGZ45170.1 hypothetical protein [Aquirufa beregesia]